MRATVNSMNLNKREQHYLLFLFTFGGFFPVCSIILHCLGLLPLQQCLFFLVIPVVSLFIYFGIRFPSVGRTVVYGFLSGIVAVFLYDMSRVPYIMNGWSDFIPKIGGWVTNSDEKNAILGYTWRYLGNGGGMGVTFFMLIAQLGDKKLLILKGLLFGLFVFTGLMMVLFFFEQTQSMMFKITPLSFTGSMTGHVIYGLTLGIMAKILLKRMPIKKAAE